MEGDYWGVCGVSSQQDTCCVLSGAERVMGWPGTEMGNTKALLCMLVIWATMRGECKASVGY